MKPPRFTPPPTLSSNARYWLGRWVRVGDILQEIVCDAEDMHRKRSLAEHKERKR